MPVTSTLETLGERLQVRILGAILDPELIKTLGHELSEDVLEEYFNSGMSSQTGRTVDALSYVGSPEISPASMSIGVIGPLSETGLPSDKGPKGTIRAFLDWYSKQKDLPQFFIRGGVPSQYAWWMLSSFQKRMLQIKRLSGEFGGEDIGPKYMWTHEKGSSGAAIPSRRFIERGLSRWRSRVHNIIDDWMQARLK
jgi:hypothetical protein